MARLTDKGDLVLEIVVKHDGAWSSIEHLLSDLKEGVVSAYTEAINDPVIVAEMVRVLGLHDEEEVTDEEAEEHDDLDPEILELMN